MPIFVFKKEQQYEAAVQTRNMGRVGRHLLSHAEFVFSDGDQISLNSLDPCLPHHIHAHAHIFLPRSSYY